MNKTKGVFICGVVVFVITLFALLVFRGSSPVRDFTIYEPEEGSARALYHSGGIDLFLEMKQPRMRLFC